MVNYDSDFCVNNGVLTKYAGAGGNVVIPEGITEIGENAFERCSSLISVVFPQTLKIIGNSAFFKCTNLLSASFFPKDF